MRDLLLAFAVLAVASPTAAAAAGACPEKATADVVTALGEPAATLSDSQAIYQPAGAAVLGMPVGYVLVVKGAAGAIQEIDYRLQGVTRSYSQPYPKAVLQAFDKAYPGVGCSTGRVTACAQVYDTRKAPAGALEDARISDPGLDDVQAKAGAPVLQTIKADYANPDSGPVFLMCLYDDKG